MFEVLANLSEILIEGRCQTYIVVLKFSEFSELIEGQCYIELSILEDFCIKLYKYWFLFSLWYFCTIVDWIFHLGISRFSSGLFSFSHLGSWFDSWFVDLQKIACDNHVYYCENWKPSWYAYHQAQWWKLYQMEFLVLFCTSWIWSTWWFHWGVNLSSKVCFDTWTWSYKGNKY